MKNAILIAFSLSFLVACSEVQEENDAGMQQVDAGRETDAGNASDAGRMEDAGMMEPDAGMERSAILITEIDPDGEWTELYNNSDTAIALGGFKVADSNSEGEARVDRASVFPAGFMLEGGAYLIVVENDPKEEGISTTCAVGTRCLHTDWGISGSNGETIFLLNPDDSVVTSATMPPNAVEDGQSYCAAPDVESDFVVCTPTPEDSNMALTE